MTDRLPSDEAPFPGAQSQVPGHREGDGEEAARRLPLPPLAVRDSTSGSDAHRTVRPLPLGHTMTPAPLGGREIRMRVRAERVNVSKEVVVYEQLTVSRSSREHTARVDATQKTEVLRVDQSTNTTESDRRRIL